MLQRRMTKFPFMLERKVQNVNLLQGFKKLLVTVRVLVYLQFSSFSVCLQSLSQKESWLVVLGRTEFQGAAAECVVGED